MEHDFLRALALLLIFEGMMPFLSPSGWKRTVFQLLHVSNRKLRIFGLVMMLFGLTMLYWVKG